MAGQTCTKKFCAGVLAGHAYSDYQSPVAVDVTTLGTDDLVEEEDPCEIASLLTEGLASFGSIDAVQAEANRTLFADRNGVNGVAVSHGDDTCFERRADEVADRLTRDFTPRLGHESNDQ